MEIRGASRTIQLEGKAEANRCVLSCFLKVWIVEHDLTESGKEWLHVNIPKVRYSDMGNKAE